MEENFYIKKTFYGCYVKNLVLPMEAILSNKRNVQGIKNLGINGKKLKNSTIRTKTNLIHRAYHNFYDSKVEWQPFLGLFFGRHLLLIINWS